MATTILYLYVIGMIVAFVMSLALAAYYEYVRKEEQNWGYVASLALMSWVTVVLFLFNYRNHFLHLYQTVRRKVISWLICWLHK